MEQEQISVNLNETPTSAKPILIRIGLLILGIVCLCFICQFLREEKPEQNNTESIQKEISNTPGQKTKYKIPANVD